MTQGLARDEIRCTYIIPETGQRCKLAAKPGREFCRKHGGNALAGMAHPNYRGKGRSKYLPARLADAYAEAQADPELLSTRNDIALVDARLADLLTRVDTGEAGKHWQDARKANDNILAALNNEDWGKLGVACIQLDRTIGEAQTDIEAWTQVQSLLETRRKLSDSEQKRLVAMRQMDTIESFMMAAGQWFVAAREAIDTLPVPQDERRRVLMSIQASFERMLNREANNERD